MRKLIKRLKDDLRVITLTANWFEILIAKLEHRPITDIRFRNGMRLSAPPEARLNFLFHEIWIDVVYGIPYGTVIDIGANVGVYSLWAAYHGCTVYAFEPSPSSAECLRSNTMNTPNVHVRQKAVAGDNTIRKLDISTDWLFHSLGNAGVDVECVTLDSILESTPCDVLKIDCEGSECEILINCKKLSKIKKIVGEIEHRNREPVRDLLSDHGFSVTEHGQGIISGERFTEDRAAA